MRHGKPRHIQHSLAVYQLARPQLRLGLAQLINCSGILDMTRFAMLHSLLCAVYINVFVTVFYSSGGKSGKEDLWWQVFLAHMVRSLWNCPLGLHGAVLEKFKIFFERFSLHEENV